MDPDVTGRILILIILLLFSAFFSSAETAFTCLNKIRVRSQMDEGSKQAALVYRLIDDPSKLLSTILVGNNIVNIAASSLTTAIMIDYFGNAAVGIATGVLTIVILIFGEITPKTLATRYSEKLAYRYAPFINLLMIILTPITFLTGRLSKLLIQKKSETDEEESSVITEQELRTIVDVSREEGVLESDERNMINNVVDFGDTEAKDIMVPAINMKCVPDDITYEELIAAFAEDQYSRMPIFSESRDNIIGLILAKDLLVKYDPSKPFSIRDYMREAYYTYESKNTRELLTDMRKEYKSLAIVLDEYGATAGLVTLEDLLEEIVGEIRDEYDTDEVDDVTAISEDEFIVSGMLNLDDFNDRFGTKLESDDYDSIAGHVIHLLNHLPETGESVEDPEAHIRFTVTALDKNRIDTLRIEVIAPNEPDSEATHE